MIDPNVMNEEYEDENGGRYQKRSSARKPVSDQAELEYEAYHEEQEMQEKEERVYNNPKHEQDEELLPGLYQSDITSWKKQYGDVFVATVKEQEFVFRALERFEYKEILGLPNTDPLMREEMICEYCVLYPQNYDFSTMANQKAGYPAVLAELIMDHSGFTRDVQVRKL
jgi:hypothetical protein